MPHERLLLLVTVGLLLAVVGCNPTPTTPSNDGRLRVFTGIPPLAYLVEQIGGSHVKVDVLVQPGQDPHTYQPTPSQVLALSRATVFFKIDMPFEAVILDKVKEGNDRLAIVDVTGGIRKLHGTGCCDEKKEEKDDDAHDAHTGETDPHVWLSPPLLKTMAANVAEELVRVDPGHRKDYERNLAELSKRLDAVDVRIRKSLAPYKGRTFYVFHPGFAYFADAYGLKETAIQVGGQAPSPRELRELIEKAKQEGVKTVFVQPEFDPSSVQGVVEAIGGQAVTINGLRRDVIADIEDIAEKVKQAMEKK